MQAVGPVRAEDRLSSLDTIRGFALLGILLMNIVGFGLFASYDDPTNSGGATGINLWTWIVLHVLAEGKMRCLFSMVFGAGIVLLNDRAEKRGSSAADVFYRRNLWLILFGIVHAYLLWLGEILYPYGLCALALYPFRVLDPKRLIRIGAVLIVITAGIYVARNLELRESIQAGQAAVAAEIRGEKLSEQQVEAKEKWQGIRKRYKPTPAEVEAKNKRWQGSFWEVLKVRAERVILIHSEPYYGGDYLDIFSMMFLGMGLFKLGVFSGERTAAFYAKMALAGYAIGVSLNSYTAYVRVSNQFDLVAATGTFAVYDVGRLSVALAHAGLLLWCWKQGAMPWLLRRLAAVGQMALTNYLTHSVVCTLVFTGWGLGLFGKLERYQLYYVVAGLWVFQLIVSPIWLRSYHFGPAEWAWRSLTYWQKQPMRKAVAA